MRTEECTAGESREPFGALPVSRWVDGSPWQALAHLGPYWRRRDVRFPPERWIKWVNAVTAKGGAVTLDLGPNRNAVSVPIGTFSEAQAPQFRAIRQALPPDDGTTKVKGLP